MLDAVRLLRRPRGIVTPLTKRYQQSHQLRFRAYVPKATMHGQLIRYGKNSAQVGFICDPPASKALILLGGLTDGLLALPYVNALVEELAPKGWCVVQAQLRSSYQAYGTASLDQDASDMLLLAQHLTDDHSIQALAFMGHSTGCQDIVRFMQTHGPSPSGCAPLAGNILQAPVSDHEWLSGYPELASTAEQARSMVAEGHSEGIVARLHVADGAPMTARRYLSLYRARGDDDMFSQHFSDTELQELLGPAGALPVLVLASGADECVPQGTNIPALTKKITSAMGINASLELLEGAQHNLQGHEHLCALLVGQFLEHINPV